MAQKHVILFYRMSIEESSTINFDTDEFLRKERTEELQLPPWVNPDKKLEEYRRRRQNHIVKRDNYKQRFIEYKMHIRRMHVGQKRKAPPTSLPEFLAKVTTKFLIKSKLNP